MSRAYDPNQRVGKFARDISRRDTISMSRAYDPVWAMDRCVPVLRSTPERDFLISPSTGPEGSGVTGETGTETHRNY